MDHTPAQSLDLRGAGSPVLPLLVRRALALLTPGQVLEVWLSSAQWARDLPRIVERAGDRCLSCQSLPQGFRLHLLRRRRGRPLQARPRSRWSPRCARCRRRRRSMVPPASAARP